MRLVLHRTPEKIARGAQGKILSPTDIYLFYPISAGRRFHTLNCPSLLDIIALDGRGHIIQIFQPQHNSWTPLMPPGTTAVAETLRGHSGLVRCYKSSLIKAMKSFN